MTLFDRREEGFEAKFAHDEELRFRALSRRNRLFGQWAATRLGKTGEDATEYAKAVIRSDLMTAGDDDMIGFVLADFQKAGLGGGETDLRAELNRQLGQAMTELEIESARR